MPGLQTHALLEASRANGPGLRAVLWLQGCTLGCPGCFNPATHPSQGGQRRTVRALVERICRLPGVEGLTVSGGEPLQQLAPLAALLAGVRRRSALSVVVFTGFTLEEAQRLPGAERLLGLVDVLIAGRYLAEQRLARGLLGSANKQMHFLSGRYAPADFAGLPEAEVIIGPGGLVTFSGIDPLRGGG